MGVNKIISFLLIGYAIYSCESSNVDDSVFISVLQQEILYDSTNIKDNRFSIKLSTILEYKNNSDSNVLLNRNRFNDFYIILKNDTLPLIPKTNKSIKSISTNSYISIEYISCISQLESEYDNKELEKEIENSLIMSYSDEKTITKKDGYFIRPLIALWQGPPNNNSVE